MAATAMTAAVPTAGLRGVKADGFLTVALRLLHFCPNGKVRSVDQAAARGVPPWVVFGSRNESSSTIVETTMIMSPASTSAMSQLKGVGCPTICAGQAQLVVAPKYAMPTPKSSPNTEKALISRRLNSVSSLGILLPL